MKKHQKSRSSGGFTLIELMVIVAIVGILMAISLPAYQNSIQKSRRTDAMRDLMELASRQERFYAQNGRYTTEVEQSNGLDLQRTISSEGHYNLTAEACAGGSLATCYQIVATPVADGSQTSDTQCAILSVDSLGRKSASGSLGDECW